MSLKIYNATASALHFGLGTFFSIYFPSINSTNPNNPTQGIELSLREHSLNFSIDPSNNTVVNTYWTSNEIANPSIQTVQSLIVSYFFITSGFHAFYASSEMYDRMIYKSNNYMRWIEYSITSTIMLYVIALLCNVKDTNIYYMIGATNVVMIAQGQAIETAIRDGGDWVTPMISGFVLLVAEFIAIVRNYIQRLNEARAFSKENPTATLQNVPGWIAYMIIVIFAFFSCFGFVSLLGASLDLEYELIEKIYIVLSFLAKATLGFFVGFGITQRQTNQI